MDLSDTISKITYYFPQILQNLLKSIDALRTLILPNPKQGIILSNL